MGDKMKKKKLKKSKKKMCDYCEKREAEIFCVGDLIKEGKDYGKSLCTVCFDVNYLMDKWNNV